MYTLTQGHTVRPIGSVQVDPKIGALNIFWLSILHPFKTTSIMNLDTYVQIWKGYQTYMCILEAVHTEDEESVRCGREEGVRMETGLLSTYIKCPKTVPKKKKISSF